MADLELENEQLKKQVCGSFFVVRVTDLLCL